MISEWNQSTLGELCTQHGGKIQTGPFGSQLHQSDYVCKGIPVVMPKDIDQQGINTSSIARVNQETAVRLSKHKLQKDEIIFPRRGEITKCALINQKQEGFLCGTGCIKITIPLLILNPLFLRYHLAKKETIEWLDGNAVGSTMKNLSTGILKKLPIHFPPLPIQKKIAEILSAYDDLIKNNLKRIKLLEEMAQINFEEWFVQMRFPGNEASSNNLTTALPEGWSNCNIGSLVNHEIGGGWGYETENEEFSSPAYVIRGTDIDGLTSGDILGVPYRYHKPSNLQSRKLTHGDIIFEVSGGSQDEGVAKTALITKNLLKHFKGTVICASFCKLARPIDIEHSLFLFHLLRFLRRTKATEVFEIRSASNIVNYNWSAFLKFQKIKRPDNALLKAFYSQNILLHDGLYNLALQNQRLREARNILLPRLMTGMIDVETYNPANLLKELS